MLEHRIEDGEQLTHAGREREFLRLADCKETAVEGADDRSATGRAEGPHVEHGPDGRPSTPHNPLASERATVPSEGRDTGAARNRVVEIAINLGDPSPSQRM